MAKKIIISVIIMGIIFTPCSFNPNYVNSTRAETYVNGSITYDTTWRLSQSPYIVGEGYGGGSLWILDSATLTIEPGVVVKMKRDNSIRVMGKIIAQGEAGNPIIFTSINDDIIEDNSNGLYDPRPGDWRSIFIYDGGQINLNHTVIRYGGFEQYYLERNNNQLLAPNSAYAQSEDEGRNVGAISIKEGGLLNINNSIIADNNIGIEVVEYWEYEAEYEAEGEDDFDIIINNSQIASNTEAGIINHSESDILATENWWGHASGPYHAEDNSSGQGDTIIGGGIEFYPWLEECPAEEEERNPVIIVPGIMGSYLVHMNDQNIETWPSIIRMIADPWDFHLNELTMNENGTPKIENPLLQPIDIFRDIISRDFFKGLVNELENNGYVEGVDLFVFPYDWRWDINLASDNDPYVQIQSLAEKISNIKQETGVEKVDIIAHSMGGLIVKKYIHTFSTSSVDKFIDIATPHLGSPSAFKVLMYGDNLGFEFLGQSILHPDRVKIISQNFPSIYQLLPSQNYFDENDNDYAYYIYDMHDLDNNNIKGRLDYDQSIEFMKNTGRNEYLLGFNHSLHSEIDNYSPQQDNIPTFNIIGCGSPTIGQIFVMNKEKSGGHEYGLKYISGDSTVPLRSAEFLESDNAYYVNNAEHAYLPSTDGVKQLIVSILKEENSSFNFADYQNVSNNKNNCLFSGTQISFHSPIELHVYDENNNHLGPDANKDIEMGIEGAQYDIIEDNKFVFLPLGQTYTIIGKATDTGYFNARIQNISNNQYEQTVYYNEIPIETTETKVEFTISDEQTEYVIQLDRDGDGDYESEIDPSSILNEQELQDLIKPETIVNILGTQINNSWVVSVGIGLIAQDNENGSGILKTEYSLDNGETWAEYQEPFIIFTLGTTTILYSSTDRAGNREENKQEIIVIIEETEITIDTTIQDIKTAYQDGDITKRWVKNSLIFRLNLLQKFINRCGNKKICKRIIKIRYKAILRSLNRYHRRGWVKNPSYDIIKEDIEYLINNL